MAKGDKFYFENFVATTELAKQAANYLVDCLENYDASKIDEMLVTMHEIENKADDKKHEMREALAKAFVTPVDREDLDMLSHQLDEVVDLIEEVLQKFYIYDITTIDAPIIDFAKDIVKSCNILCEIMGEFENFKKSKKLYNLIIELNDVEEDCDKLYLSSMRALTTKKVEPLETIAWRNIYESLEECADACEHVSECVASVIMKNS
jgi:predicted phosphate transport protein (TIGR00153 family)